MTEKELFLLYLDIKEVSYKAMMLSFDNFEKFKFCKYLIFELHKLVTRYWGELK